MPKTGNWGRILIPALILAGMWGSVALLKTSGLRVNWTASEPVGVYWLHPVTGPLHRGQRIEFCPPVSVSSFPFLMKGDCPGGAEHFIKSIAGVPGDIVTVTDLGVKINGVMLPGSRPSFHSHSDPSLFLPVLRGKFRLGTGQYWTYGSGSPGESFDSRYWGPISISAISGSA